MFSQITDMGLSAEQAAQSMKRFQLALTSLPPNCHVEVFELGEWIQLGAGGLNELQAIDRLDTLRRSGWDKVRICKTVKEEHLTFTTAP